MKGEKTILTLRLMLDDFIASKLNISLSIAPLMRKNYWSLPATNPPLQAA